ncbi:hypothetical protein P879_01308 [Paragonimus westermani]|uniref:MIF4G domain-containing protein n=1 Tax=Paragonimus westermani TaxID=34504 RepID=A0A8T0DEK2_9TREM|nr:hypothetical protein P879_01308 [Paragonimus westermani]
MENTALELEERKQLSDFVSEVSERLTLRTKLLEENLAVVGKWPDENFFVKKDSTLKKNTAFVKKIRNFLDSQKEPLLVEFDMLNLSKYVEEVATAIVEAKIKTTDIPFILKLCSAMYQRYADFGSLFLDAWKKVFSAYKDMKHANMSKFRVDLALFADLNTIGIFRESEGVRLLAGQLTALTNGDLETFSNVGILCSFCRHCSDDWIGLIPRRIRILSEKYHIAVPRSKFMPTERQAKCRTLFQEYLANAKCYLQNIVKNACRLVSANRKQMENRGEVSEERKEHADQLLLNCRKLHESLCTLVDLLDSDPLPDFASMIKEVSVTDDANIIEHDQSDQETSSQLFEDEETRLFYESLPDIKAMVPGILYKESEQVKLDVNRDKSEEAESAETEDIDVETLESELAKEEALFKAADDASFGDAESVHLAERDKLPSALRVDDAAEDPSSSGKVLMETFLTQLPNCVNRDLIDRAAIDFCLNLNKRSNRRRLARALLMVPRTRYDLLPFYARLVAALAPVMPDLVMDVNAMLTGEFRWRVSKRDQLNLESKLKIVRFIGELVKFRIFPAHQALSCLKLLLPQFVHHNIEMACALLDTCGRFLYRLPVSHQRTKVYLEVMIRKKTALHMDQRYTIMIENTYYYCNPPPSTRQIAKAVELTPEMQYIRRLLLRDLDRVSVNNVLRSIRKINWEDPELLKFTETIFTQAWDIRFTNINRLASVLSGLAVLHRNFATAVVDNVIEDIRVGMELNLPHLNQRRISMVKYLGLLYNYCLIDSPVVFKVLYSLLTFGISLDNNVISLLDPPDSLFRITLICTLLETSGEFFDQGKKHRKLMIFLVYFQRYYWFKRSQPFWIQPQSAASLPSTKESSSVDVAGDHSERPQNANSEQASIVSENAKPAGSVQSDSSNVSDATPNAPTFTPVPFPAAVEQHYLDTVSQLGTGLTRAKNLAHAHRLVSRVEAHYLPRLARLKATYSLPDGFPNTSGQDSDSCSVASGRPTGPGHMDTIAEEAEPCEDTPLDGVDYAVDDDDDEDEEEEDGDVEDDCLGEDGEHGRRRARINQMEIDGHRQPGLGVTDGQKGETSVKDDNQSTCTPNDDDTADAVESEEEEAVRLGLKPRFIDCPEDAEFREALDRMTAEALMSTGPVVVTPTVAGSAADSIAGPIRPPVGPVLPPPDTLQLAASRARCTGNQSETVATTTGKTQKQLLEAMIQPVLPPPTVQTKSDEENYQSVSKETPSNTDTSEEPAVVFNLITRRGNRPHLVPLVVPETVQFAARYMQAEAAEREEKARMKQLVLEMHEAQKEEEMEWGYLGSQDAVLAHEFPVNVNRDRWIRYTHPKGAPDADTVFGTSSQRR